MKKPVLTLLLAAVCAFGALTASQAVSSAPSANTTVTTAEETTEKIDYAGQAKLNFDAETQTIEVTVKSYIDGDTTHFYAEGFPEGVLKARYQAVNTPESTGKLEEWGKTAARFTRSKLESAISIVIESNSNKWETDSTGERTLSWVWYKSADMTDYRCLNLELLQEGLAWGSKASESRYGELATAALAQALALKLYVHAPDDVKDPDFFYGDSIEVDLKELRLNIDSYSGKRVAFEGIVSYYVNQGVYVENYDEETQMYYGIYVYYGFNSINSQGVSVLALGNKVRITGVVQYYEAGNSYQVSDLKYNQFMPGDDDIRLIEKGYSAANVLTSVAEFKKTLTLEIVNPETEETTKKQYKYAELAMNTSISMKNLLVTDAYTTQQGNNEGAMTLTCESNGQTVTVRTVVLRDNYGNLATEDMLVGKTIDVMGVVDCFDGEYQIKVLSTGGIKVDGEPLVPPVTPPASSETPSSEVTSEENSSPSTSSPFGCGSVIGISTTFPLLAAVAVVLMKKRENKNN